MKVQFYDIINVLPIGNCQPVDLDTLLKSSDIVSLHVPKTEQTHHLISKSELDKMKPGSYLINAARGDVIVADEVAAAVKSGKLAGVAIDVFEVEPEANSNEFKNPLQNLPNVILTPHCGGSTEEAQAKIGIEVATNLIRFLNEGTTDGATNVPQFIARPCPNSHRLLNFHKNMPGVIRDINNILSDYNVSQQLLGTQGKVGFTIIDVEKSVSQEVFERLWNLQSSIKTRKIS